MAQNDRPTLSRDRAAGRAEDGGRLGVEDPQAAVAALAELAERRLPEHAHRLVQTCLLLHRDPALADLGLRRWAHMLVSGGHFSSRSRRYPVTLGPCGQRGRPGGRSTVSLAPEWTAPRDERGWRFVGQGWRTAGQELLVETAARCRLLAMAGAREQRRVERRSLTWVA